MFSIGWDTRQCEFSAQNGIARAGLQTDLFALAHQEAHEAFVGLREFAPWPRPLQPQKVCRADDAEAACQRRDDGLRGGARHVQCERQESCPMNQYSGYIYP